jgi:hypothetical protein
MTRLPKKRGITQAERDKSLILRHVQTCLEPVPYLRVIPQWYHFLMAMTLRLSEKQSAALKKVAENEGASMHEIALTAIDEYISKRQLRLKDAISRIAVEDKELLDRLAK